jgi:hypothetical protein
VHLRRLLSGVIGAKRNVVIYNDKQSVTKLSSIPLCYSRTMHVREFVENDYVELKYMLTEKMPADMLTKGLTGPKNKKCVKGLTYPISFFSVLPKCFLLFIQKMMLRLRGSVELYNQTTFLYSYIEFCCAASSSASVGFERPYICIPVLRSLSLCKSDYHVCCKKRLLRCVIRVSHCHPL